VFITDRGRPAHVLLSIAEYQRLTGKRRSIADALAMPEIADIEFEAPRVTIGLRPADSD
jgi:PHD/YefM family antitoxin component YafN of YafNO toxin-antitoxin module